MGAGGKCRLAMVSGDLDGAISGFEVAVDGHCAHGNRYLELTARYMLACALATSGRAQSALRVSSETAALCEQYGERNARAYTDWAAAIAYWTLDQLDEAERSAHRVLKAQHAMGDGVAVALATTTADAGWCGWSIPRTRRPQRSSPR